jgi:hypothetical protein
MRPSGLQPFTTDAWEVRDVEGHNDTFLDAGEFQQRLIRASIEITRLIDCEHIVLALAQGRADPAA